MRFILGFGVSRLRCNNRKNVVQLHYGKYRF